MDTSNVVLKDQWVGDIVTHFFLQDVLIKALMYFVIFFFVVVFSPYFCGAFLFVCFCHGSY